MSVAGRRGAKSRGRGTIAWGALALFAWGCGGSAANPAREPEPEPAEQEKKEEGPFDAQALFSRESEPLEPKAVRGRGDGWRALIEARIPPTLEVEEGGVQKISIELGWEQPMTCRVYPGPLDVGQTLSQTLANVSQVARVQSVLGYGVEHAGLEPIVFVRAVYEVERGEERGAGDLKILLAPNAAGSVFCLHDALGYARSFQRVGGDFVRSFEFATPPPTPRRGELWVQTIDGLPVGFTAKKEFVQEGGKGALRTTIASKFIPVSPEALATSDTADIVQLNQQGEIEEGNWIAFQEGREEYAVKLERKDKSYAVTGRVRGAAVDDKFTPRAPLWSDVSLNRQFQKLARAGQPATFRSEEYLPGIDAVHATEVSYEMKPREGGFAIEALVQGKGMVLLADERGLPRAFQIPLPGTEVRGILLTEQGEP